MAETTLPHYQKGLTFEDVWAALMENREQMKETDRLVKETAQIIKENAERQKETDRQMKETDRLFKESREQMKETDRQMKETAQIIKENAERQKETAKSQKETDRQMKETDRLIKENAERQKETSQQMKETDKQIKEFNKRHGEDSNRFGQIVEYMVAPSIVKKFSELGVVFEKAYQNTKIQDKKNGIDTEADITLENSKKVMLVEIKTKQTTEHIKNHIERLEKMRRYADLHGDKRIILGAIAGVIMTPM